MALEDIIGTKTLSRLIPISPTKNVEDVYFITGVSFTKEYSTDKTTFDNMNDALVKLIIKRNTKEVVDRILSVSLSHMTNQEKQNVFVTTLIQDVLLVIHPKVYSDLVQTQTEGKCPFCSHTIPIEIKPLMENIKHV
jgi:hypothetical protein